MVWLLELSPHLFHDGERDHAWPFPHRVLLEGNLIGDVETNEDLPVELRGLLRVILAIGVRDVRGVGDDGRSVLLAEPMNFLKEYFPRFLVVVEVVHRAEMGSADLVAAHDVGVRVLGSITLCPSGFPAARDRRKKDESAHTSVC